MEADLTSKIETLMHHALTYAEQRKDLIVLDVIEKSSRAVSSIIASALFAAFGFLVLLFFSISASWAIGLALDSIPLGFLFVGVFYLILLVLSLALNKTFIQSKLITLFIVKFYKETKI